MVHGGERWSFGALDQRSAQIAAWLEARGAGPDDLVAFSLPNGPDFLALTFAIYRCGATPAPLSPKLPNAERDAILATMRPRCFFTANDLPQPKWDDLPPLSPLHVAASWKACTCGGSTGRPKVIVDGRAAKFAATTDFIAILRDSHVLVPGPLYHNAPFSAAVFALWKGNTVVTMRGSMPKQRSGAVSLMRTRLHLARLSPRQRDLRPEAIATQPTRPSGGSCRSGDRRGGVPG